MKAFGYGDKSGLNLENAGTLVPNDNNSIELFKNTDVLSARTLNRPVINLFDNQEENYNLVKSLLKSVYGNFDGIVPEVYEEFSEDGFKYGIIGGNEFLRIPTGLLFTCKENDSYFLNNPKISLFERQLAYLINFDLNDQNNDIKLNCEFVDKSPRYSITITNNSGEVVNLPENYLDRNTIPPTKKTRDIKYRNNSIDIFNDFLDFYSDEIKLSPGELYKLNCLETIIPVDNLFTSGELYYLYYGTNGFYLSRNNEDEGLKLFSLYYEEGEVLATRIINVLEKGAIISKKAELDSLLVNEESNLNGDFYLKNTYVVEEGEIEPVLVEKTAGISFEKTDEDKISLKIYNGKTETSEGSEIEIEEKNIKIKNAEIDLENTNGLKITKKDKTIISTEYDDEEEVLTIKKDGEEGLEELLEIKKDEITTNKTIAPTKDRQIALGTPLRRFLIYGDVEGGSSSILYSENNLIITNMDLNETRKVGHDIGKKFISENSIVYHFDTDYLNNHGETDIESEINGRHELTVKYDPETNIADNPIYPYQPFQDYGKYVSGDFILNHSVTSNNGIFSLDFWYRYTPEKEGNFISITNGEQDYLKLKSAISEVPFYTDVIEEGEEFIPTDYPFYQPSEEETSGRLVVENYIEGEYARSDYNYINNQGEAIPILFVVASSQEAPIVIISTTSGDIETVLKSNKTGKPITYEKNDWMHIGVIFSDTIKLFIDNNEYEFTKLDTSNNLNINIDAIALDELMIDNSTAESFEIFKLFNNEVRYNWATLDYEKHNFVLDIKKVEEDYNVYSNLFESSAFVEAVKNIVRNM